MFGINKKRKTLIFLFFAIGLLIFCTSCTDISDQTPLSVKILKPKKAEEKLNFNATFKIKLADNPGNISKCIDECTFTLPQCEKRKLLLCTDANNDSCMEKTEKTCTFGCSEGRCNQQIAIKDMNNISFMPLSYFKKKPLDLNADNNCTGRLIGMVQFNAEGSLCRKGEYADVGYGFHNTLTCCKRYFSGTECTSVHGMIKRGIVRRSQYYAVGCYEAAGKTQK